MNERIALQPVDAADVTILVDNSLDMLLPSTAVAQRPSVPWNWSQREQLIAEHGYALLLAVRVGQGIFARVGRLQVPLVLHPDAWRERKAVYPSGKETHLPPPSREDMAREGVQVVEERGPSLLAGGTVLVTGQVERVTGFEKGFPPQQARTGAGWEPDPWVWDDQAVVCLVKGKGLVVLSGCSHCGVVNVLRYAQKLTGIDEVHAVVGGLHLSGELFEPIIPRTIHELKAIGPDLVVPGHCTGWQAIHQLARILPAAYIPSSVGTRLHFG
jgi:7,8-dihydropterin-6-yl-methyl-4-(beta-D-ribofuranosyl)aminobenzene 5'-phosphate synthase